MNFTSLAMLLLNFNFTYDFAIWISCRCILDYQKKKRWRYAVHWIMRNSQLKLASTFLRTKGFHQKVQSELSCLRKSSSKAYSKPPTKWNAILIHLLVLVRLEGRERKMKPVNKLCSMLVNLILQLTMRSLEPICKECNGGWRNWRKFAWKCKHRWQKSWSQEYQAIAVLPDPYPSFVHDRIFCSILKYLISLSFVQQEGSFYACGICSIFLSFIDILAVQFYRKLLFNASDTANQWRCSMQTV